MSKTTFKKRESKKNTSSIIGRETIYNITTFFCRHCKKETTFDRKCVVHHPERKFWECFKCDNNLIYFHECEF